MPLKSKRNVQWPKVPPPLTPEQIGFQKEFLRLWHEILPQKYGLIEAFNHNNPLLRRSVKSGNCVTLEIGGGLGEHLFYEDMKNQDYTVLEIRDDFIDTIRKRFPGVKTMVADIQESLPLPDGYFDRIIAIHVLEHLRNLPAALKEIKRLLKPDGEFVVVIPCEGGFAYHLARRLSAQRIFEKKFKTSYLPIIKNEHVSDAREILDELSKYFSIEKKIHWPLKIPIMPINLVMALTCKP